MSDSFIAVLGMGFLAGIVTTLTMIGVINVRDNKRLCTNDSDMRLYIPSRDRDRSGNNRRLERLEAEIEREAKRLGVKLGGKE